MLAYQRGAHLFFERIARRHGDISHFRFSGLDTYLLNHPDYIKEVLVTNNQNFTKGVALQRAKRLLGEGLLTSEGEFHRRQRRLAQPAFHRQRVAVYGEVMTEYAGRTSARWRDGETLDIADEMMRLTLAIVGKTLFDADVESEADEIGAAMNAVMDLFNALTIPFFELLEKLPTPQMRRFKHARARLDRIMYRMIDERRRSGEDRGDLLSMLLLAEDEEGASGGMSDTQVRDEALTIFLAGHETTANALTWTWYLLSQNPEAEARFHDELRTVLENRAPTPEDFPRLRYTEMVLAESMRLFPPAWAIGRRSIEACSIGGFNIPARSLVLMSQYVTQRDARYFPEPERFDPNRWLPENRDERPQFSYFPFGGGPRRCIGEGFAWLEGVLLLATLGQKWQMRLVANHPVALRPVITLRPKYGMRMIVSKR